MQEPQEETRARLAEARAGALARIESLGGMTVLGRQAVGDMGWAAYFKDVEGNLMGLWQQRTS